MELSKLFPRGPSFKFTPTPARFNSFHSAHNARSANCPKRIWAVSLIIVTSLLLLYFFQAHHHPLQQDSQKQHGYGVVIDIGRVEARVHVVQFEETESVKVLGRTSSLPPYNVPELLATLLEYAEGLVPEAERAHSRVYVLATGSLVWVPEDNRLDFLAECRKSVRKSGFMFRDEWAMVLNGRDKGVNEWVAANYARSNVETDSTGTIGVLDIGDQSAQVTFVSESVPPFAYFRKIKLQGTTYNLYSYSFDKLGLVTASESLQKLLHARTVASSTGNSRNKVVLDPCCPPGFRGPKHFGTEVAGEMATVVETFPTIPSGNFSACRAESLALIKHEHGACYEKDCPAGTVFVPELRGNFIATGYFYKTSEFFDLPGNASLGELVAVGESYCGGEVKDFIHSPFPEYEFVRMPCFSAAFIVAFLHDSLGLPVSGSKVLFSDAGVPVEWTVGFFVLQLLEEEEEKKKSNSSVAMLIFGEVLENSVGLFVGVSALLGVGLWVVARWRRPQLKTIYDLEKGRYFTTAARGR